MHTIHYSTCPLCQSSDIGLALKAKDHKISGEEFEIWDCKNCGFRFTQDVPDQDHIGEYYKGEIFISHSDTKEGVVNRLYHRARKVMLDRKYSLIHRLSSGRELMDFGAGTGYFLDHMRQRGYTVHGVEIDSGARAFAQKKFGIHIDGIDTFYESKAQEAYDVITMWHVLEHIEDPHDLLQRLHRMLRPGGKMLIALPNHNSSDGKKYQQYWSAYDVPRHLWHFEPKTLELMIEQNGWKMDSMHRLPFDPFYNAILSEQFRAASLALVRGGVAGLTSTLSALATKRRASSLIYVVSKA